MPAADDRNDQGYLNRLHSDRLPREVVGDIFAKAKNESLLLSLGREIPVSVNENVVWADDTYPEAGQVGGTTLASREGEEKPIQGIEFATPKVFSPIKLAVIVTVSEEFARTNPDQLYSNLAPKLAGAIGRAADLAAFHNKDAVLGTDLVGTTNNSYVNATTNRVDLDLSQGANPDAVAQLLAGVSMVEDDEDGNYEVSAFAARPSVRTKLATLRDANGNPVFQGAYPGSGAEINLRAGMNSLFGLPVAYSRTVRGKVGAVDDQGVLMFAGDFSQLAWGFADDIRIKVSDQATVGGVSMWQTNQIAVLAEATFGWIVNDPNAFVAYDLPAGS